jgi:tRNA(Ile)-lysidine synthase
MSEAGFALVDAPALAAAPEEIALRALARVIEAVGGSGERVRLAKLETLLEALREQPGKAHTLGRCRIEPVAGRLGIFREVRGEGLPITRLRPGEKALWDNRFRIELGAGEPEPIVVKALGEEGLRALRDREALPPSLPRLAGRALPACWRGEVLLGLPRLGSGEAGRRPGLDCRATFVGAATAQIGGTAQDLGR